MISAACDQLAATVTPPLSALYQLSLAVLPSLMFTLNDHEPSQLTRRDALERLPQRM